MRRTFLALAALALSAVVSAQTARTVALQTVFPTYLGNTAHWTDPVTRGPSFVAQDNAFWHGPDGSWGAITITAGTQYPTFIDVQATIDGCNTGPIFTAVNAAMGPVPLNTIRHIVLPPGSPCNSFTSGNVLTAGSATIYTVGGAFMEHETGHALGLGHAVAAFCDSSITVPFTCANTAAYGPYDVMGDGGTHGAAIHVASRQQLNLYSPTFQLASVTTSQDVVLQIVGNMTAGIKGLTAAKPGTQFHAMTAELRGGDSASFGVILHGSPQGYLLMTNPSNGPNPWAMRVGQTVCDPTYVCLTLVSVTGSTATVHVDIGGTSVPAPINHTR